MCGEEIKNYHIKEKTILNSLVCFVDWFFQYEYILLLYDKNFLNKTRKNLISKHDTNTNLLNIWKIINDICMKYIFLNLNKTLVIDFVEY